MSRGAWGVLPRTGGVFLLVLGVSWGAGAQGGWSSLYPVDWQPGYQDGGGRFLHDFSYAGYHNGAQPLPPQDISPVFDAAVEFGADATGATDATGAVQSAINAAQAAGGGTVVLPAGLYRCDGSLLVTASRVHVRGAGRDATRVYFTQHEGMAYETHLAFLGTVVQEGEFPLAEDGVNRSRTVRVADASGLAVGDEVALGWVITDEFVAEHGMTGTWTEFNGLWRPFFRREITGINTAVSPVEVELDVPLRYSAKLRDGASLRKESGYLSECALRDLALSDAVGYDDAWAQDQAHLVRFAGVKDCALQNVASFASPHPGNTGYHLQSGGILVEGSKRVTVAGCTLEKAQNRGSGGNGYLFEVRQSGEILFQDCVGRDGRHNFIQNWDFGATGIVWLRCESTGGRAVTRLGNGEVSKVAYSEYHHSLATANLVDSCRFDDGWSAGNRKLESSGAGHSATQCVCWNTIGLGDDARIRSFNYGNGYVIGTRNLEVLTVNDIPFGGLNTGTEPADFTEFLDAGDRLLPQSLYLDQLQRRTSPGGIPTEIVEEFTATVGDNVCFSVIYPGSAPSGSFTWTHYPDGDAPPVVLAGRNGPQLILRNVQSGQGGVYTASYDNGAKAAAVYTARLTVHAKVPAAGAGGLLLLLVPLFVLQAAGLARPGRGAKPSPRPCRSNE